MAQLPVEILATLDLGNGVEKGQQDGQDEQDGWDGWSGKNVRNGKNEQNVS